MLFPLPRRAALAAVLLATLVVAAPAGAGAGGSFAAGDDLLTRIWQASVKTADDDISTPVNLDRRDCNIDLPVVILDGPVRDRCPYIGDLAVTGMTLLVSGGHTPALRSMIAWFASAQLPDGSIPDSPIFDGEQVLTDYNAYWVETLYDYTLYTGDLTLLRSVFASLERLMDVLYPAHVGADGLLDDWLGGQDYAFIVRDGTEIAYFQAQYVRALGLASTLARWAGASADATSWQSRAQAAAAPFAHAFWDPAFAAFGDTTDDLGTHPLDANVFAILAGLATPAQERSILAFVDGTLARPEGDAQVDDPSWNSDHWGDDATQHIYPFIGYFDVLARYAAGADDSALDLIRREWGFMLDHGPGTMWETISAATGTPTGQIPSWDHGLASGAAPALTGYVLGVLPTSPGFATFTVAPHPSGVASAAGIVPTPSGDVRVFWQLATDGTPRLSITAPKGTTWTNGPGGPVNRVAPSLSGRAAPGAVVSVDRGTWTGAPRSFAYRWARCSPDGIACTPIAGATGATYAVSADDAGSTLRAFVTATAGGRPGSAVTDAAAVGAAPLVRLVVAVKGKGRISPAGGRFRSGSRVELTATPAAGWRFSGWSGAACGTGKRRCVVTVTAPARVAARFDRVDP